MVMGLPERLKEMRTKLGLSQREVARLLELSPSVVSAYETGERTPSTEILLRLSNLYKCSTDYLLGITDYNIHDMQDVAAELKKIAIRLEALQKYISGKE